MDAVADDVETRHGPIRWPVYVHGNARPLPPPKIRKIMEEVQPTLQLKEHQSAESDVELHE